MKQITIENVKARISKLQSRGNAEYSLGLTLNEEFELACLRLLANSMGGVDDDVRSVVALLENNEWAEHCTKTELGQRLESEITRLVGGVQPVPVVSDALPLADSKDLTAAQLQSIINDDWLLMDDCEGMQNCAAVKALARMALKSDINDYLCDSAYVSGMQAGWNFGVVEDSEGFQSSLEHYRKGMREYRSSLRNQAQEPATDNTAQQFEALATSCKSEHLLNAERIAREAKALSDQLNATSAVHHRVSGWSERQQKVIAYSLWRFSCTAYQQANQAAQTNNKDMFDRFIRDARCAEEIREEFTSAWIGNL
ncbi:EaA protein [Salmonella phage PT1]|nr:EaA protein [Salmonella phage PT1]